MIDPVTQRDASARVALEEVIALRRRVRADRHPLSVPLLVMGLIAAGGSLLNLLSRLSVERAVASGASTFSFGWSSAYWYWRLAVPAGFGALALVEWWRWHRRGLGAGGRRFAVVTVLACAAAGVPFAWFLTEILGPLTVIGGGLLIAGLWQRLPSLAVVGAVVCSLGVVEGLFWIDYRLPASLWRGWAHQAAFLTVAGAMVVAGIVAFIRERRAAR